MREQLHAIRSFLSRPGNEGGHIPRVVVYSAMLGAVATFGVGVLGVETFRGSTSEFAAFLNGLAWCAVILGAFLALTGWCLSETQSARGWVFMKCQLVAGAIFPVMLPAVLVGVWLAAGALALWLMWLLVLVLIDP